MIVLNGLLQLTLMGMEIIRERMLRDLHVQENQLKKDGKLLIFAEIVFV